jgi:hypothetical protein
MIRHSIFFVAILMIVGTILGDETKMNILQNPDFDFHAFTNHRDGNAESFKSHNVAFWNTDAWKDITVMRESHVDPKIRPAFSVHNMVSVQPGKKIWQFFTLPEAGLAHGEKISLFANGYQDNANALKASVKILKLDSEDGTWTPGDFGYSDKRTFPKHARGELVVAKSYDAVSNKTGSVELKIEGAEIVGKFTADKESHSSDVNSIAIRVEFENTGKTGDVWVYSPCLSKDAKAMSTLPEARPLTAYYRNIPKTIQKLWKGETVNIVVMGSSIDRGSANPPMYLYNEDPDSPDFKKPISESLFDASKINRPDLDGHFGQWRHYFSYGGRLKLELMRKFNLPASKICLVFMACDGSCVGEAHSGLKEYFSMSIPPSEEKTGHKAGRKWDELHPDLSTRPQGSAPDLVIFGSGANEKTDTPDEVAVYEGMIRWIQRHYPNTEFLFSQFQNYGAYTSATGDLQALSLRYQIPFLDYGKVGDDIARWCNRYALIPADGHPQAAVHYLWFKQIEKAFECWDPIMPGIAQLQLPERVHKNTYGWEGDMLTYDEKSGRLKGGKFIFDDTAVNCWGKVDDKVVPQAFVDGKKGTDMRVSFPGRDIRNSFYRQGNCSLGDRHILEISGQGAKLTFADAKICPDRRFFPVDNGLWKTSLPVVGFESEWGAPFGNKQIQLNSGDGLEIDVVSTDISIAYVDTPQGGDMKVSVDGVEKLLQSTNVPFVDIEKNNNYIENKKAVLNLGYGLHQIKIKAVKGPVNILGLYTYDSRPNKNFERRLNGFATAGETVNFSLSFKTRPFVICGNGLQANTQDITAEKVTFSGSGQGTYEVIGE